MSLSFLIKHKAVELGFDLAGITHSGPVGSQDVSHLKNWLNNGYEGDMAYMRGHFEKRTNPAKLMDGCKSVICVGLNYKPFEQPDVSGADKPVGTVADYAIYEDYHVFIKARLHLLAQYIAPQIDNNFKYKVCVDSVPLLERPLAARAGLGFIGKNHCLINPKLGTEILLGELLVNIELENDKPAQNLCAGCDKCIKACPTSALMSNGNMDARKCISYLTIEHDGPIRQNLAKKIGNHLFGCDVCIKACPLYLSTPCRAANDMKVRLKPRQLDLRYILEMNEQEFNRFFKGTAFHRTGLQNLKRNARICLMNIAEINPGLLSQYGFSYKNVSGNSF